jgi:hypothetical protein
MDRQGGVGLVTVHPIQRKVWLVGAYAVEIFLIAAILKRLVTGSFPDLTANSGAHGAERHRVGLRN